MNMATTRCMRILAAAAVLLVTAWAVHAQNAVTLPQGITRTDLSQGDTQAILNLLARTTELAISENGVYHLVDLLARPDRQRIGIMARPDVLQVNAIVQPFRQQWMQRYGQSFGIADPQQVFGGDFTRIQGGRIADLAQLANWPVDPAHYVDSPETPQDELRTYLQQGQQVAVMAIPPRGGLPQFTVSLIQEDDEWKLDIPDNIDAQQLRANLVQHINEIALVRGEWPANVEEAYRAAAQHMVMALYNVNALPQQVAN